MIAKRRRQKGASRGVVSFDMRGFRLDHRFSGAGRIAPVGIRAFASLARHQVAVELLVHVQDDLLVVFREPDLLAAA